jgi:hypothetical protein
MGDVMENQEKISIDDGFAPGTIMRFPENEIPEGWERIDQFGKWELEHPKGLLYCRKTGQMLPKIVFPIYHLICGKLAFYSIKRWQPGFLMKASEAIMLDGNHPEPGSQIRCGSCGKQGTGPDFTYEKPKDGGEVEK